MVPGWTVRATRQLMTDSKERFANWCGQVSSTGCDLSCLSYDLRRDTKKPASGFTMRPFGMSSIASAKERLVR